MFLLLVDAVWLRNKHVFVQSIACIQTPEQPPHTSWICLIYNNTSGHENDKWKYRRIDFCVYAKIQQQQQQETKINYIELIFSVIIIIINLMTEHVAVLCLLITNF